MSHIVSLPLLCTLPFVIAAAAVCDQRCQSSRNDSKGKEELDVSSLLQLKPALNMTQDTGASKLFNAASYEGMFSMLAASSVLTLKEICSTLDVNEIGCQRVETYIGKALANVSKQVVAKHKVSHDHVSHAALGECAITTRTTLDACPGSWIDNAVCDFAHLFSYIPSRLARDHPFVIAPDDWAPGRTFKLPTLVRSASVEPVENQVVVAVDRSHHMNTLISLPQMDMALSAKADRLVWRGANTGAQIPSQATGKYANGSRLLLVQKYFDTSDQRIDVGLSGAVGGCPTPSANWIKGQQSMEELLKNKFIMVVEGNAEATGLEWALASTSVVFMVKPTVLSWTLQTWLQPWVHYVPVESDFSNLPAMVDWALDHPHDAQRIAAKGQEFMQEFSDSEREHRINAAVLVAYFNRVKIQDEPTEDKPLCSPSSPGEFESGRECQMRAAYANSGRTLDW